MTKEIAYYTLTENFVFNWQESWRLEDYLLEKRFLRCINFFHGCLSQL